MLDRPTGSTTTVNDGDGLAGERKAQMSLSTLLAMADWRSYRVAAKKPGVVSRRVTPAAFRCRGYFVSHNLALQTASLCDPGYRSRIVSRTLSTFYLIPSIGMDVVRHHWQIWQSRKPDQNLVAMTPSDSLYRPMLRRKSSRRSLGQSHTQLESGSCVFS